MITIEQLKKIVPAASKERLELLVPYLNTYMPAYDILSPVRAAAFIAQVAHESGSFNFMEEIADGSAYEGRAGLGNNQPGDGKRFKGRGLIQITGRANYTRLSNDILQSDGFIKHPEWVAIPAYAVESACWFWKLRGLNILADKGDFQDITRRINGGLNGYADRLRFYNKAKKILNVK